MKLGSARAADRLAVEAKCLAALFTSYTFDPLFFEETILRTVLRLQSDPLEQQARFLDEARAALIETPVACIVDASMRTPGKRMPYELLEVSTRTFHPKVTLLLFETFARVHVGSGNLTRGGYGDNAELFVTEDFAYDEPAAAALLRELDAFFDKIARLARTRGAQLEFVRAELARRIARTPASDTTPLAILHTERNTPILEQLLMLVPDDGRITRVGVLAPFFEKDDAATGAELRSVLGHLATSRSSKDLVLDIGVSWDDAAAVARPEGAARRFDAAIGALWARVEKARDDEEQIAHFVLDGLSAQQLRVRDARGIARRLPRDLLEETLEDGKAWPTPRPRVFAPAGLVDAISDLAIIRPWLYPAWTLDEGRRVHRPLHAKLLLASFTRRGRAQTLVLIGSPNASRRALLQTPAQGSNVELALAILLDGEVTLPDVATPLVACDAGAIDWAERTFPDASPNLAMCIESASYDPKEGCLTVTWASPPPYALGTWSLRYGGERLGSGTGVPNGPTIVVPFNLTTSTSEVELSTTSGSFFVPILVTDLVSLPSNPTAPPLSLTELLLLLSRRLTLERREIVRAASQASGDLGTLDELFGEGFAPTDVFKAWWSGAQDLVESGCSLASFRRRLEGPTGVAGAWRALRDAAEKGDEVRREEGWFYGAELLRTLEQLELPDDPSTPEKRACLDMFTATLREGLSALAPAGAAWLDRVAAFYGVGT
jgi:hypothetical protein